MAQLYSSKFKGCSNIAYSWVSTEVFTFLQVELPIECFSSLCRYGQTRTSQRI